MGATVSRADGPAPALPVGVPPAAAPLLEKATPPKVRARPLAWRLGFPRGAVNTRETGGDAHVLWFSTRDVTHACATGGLHGAAATY